MCRWCAKEDIGVKDFDLTKWKIQTTQLYNKVTGNDYVYLGGDNKMAMKIIAIRIGERYGPEYEIYLEEKLPEYEFIWIRKPIREDVLLQWNKMYAMSLDIDDPVVVMDIDVLLTNNYKELFEYPVKKGQFVSIPGSRS